MEQHDPALATTRVYVLNICSRKASCLRSMLCLLHQLSSCGLGTLLSSTQVTLILGLH
ncbi:hypothetical protein GW17_00011813 [Ensete ventricosum]|nr:hypothetical protein GW17_00011813 [Ensete ventricosum]